MKNRKRFITGCVGLLVLGVYPMAVAQTASEAALLAVMQAKSESYFFETDTKKWQTFWIQDDNSSRSIISKFGYSHQIGWPAVTAEVTKNKTETGRYPSAQITYENVHVRQSATLAFVEADERVNLPGVDAGSAVLHTYTVLAYADNRWKLASQVRVETGSFAPTADNREYELNTIGYELLSEKRVAEATDLFVLNVKLNPTSWNAYDSLGEAYALAGNTQQAIAHYEKSLQLNPKNEAGREALARLKKQ